MQYTTAQEQIIAVYLNSTKLYPELRLTIDSLVKLSKHIPRDKPDIDTLAKSENYNGKGRPKRQLDNSYVFSILQGCDYYQSTVRFSWIDDILTGVCKLDLGGNTRSLNVVLLYSIISSINTIDSAVIMEYCSVKARQAQKILLSLSIAIRAIEKEFLIIDRRSIAKYL